MDKVILTTMLIFKKFGHHLNDMLWLKNEFRDGYAIVDVIINYLCLSKMKI